MPWLYRKYGLNLDMVPYEREGIAAGSGAAYRYNIALAIRNHWFVCRWLEEHPDDRTRYGEPGFMYYDVLALAEAEYLELPPFLERDSEHRYPDLEGFNFRLMFLAS